MRARLGNKYLTLAFRVVLGAVFIYASLDKIAFPGDFAFAIRNYKMLPDPMSNLLAILLPWLELYCGLFLFVGLFTRTSAAAVAFMLVIFIVAIGSAIFRGLDISCGCFKTVDQASKVGLSRLIEDIGLLVMAAQIIFFGSSFASVGNFFSWGKDHEDL